MSLMRGLFVLLFLLMITFGDASGADDVSVDFCKLLANPENFAGRVISVRGSHHEVPPWDSAQWRGM